MPNLAKMASVGGPARKQDSMNQPYDAESLKNPFGEGLEDSFMNTYLDTKIGQNAKMTFELENTLGNLGKKLGLKKKVSSLLAEDVATDGENENE